jgi:hypothetical protein
VVNCNHFSSAEYLYSGLETVGEPITALFNCRSYDQIKRLSLPEFTYAALLQCYDSIEAFVLVVFHRVVGWFEISNREFSMYLTSSYDLVIYRVVIASASVQDSYRR